MNEHIEQGTLPSGKKAVIALTSWKNRINTVGLTIYNLFTMCGPEFHIVLTLAEEEFPRKERELPRDLVLMNKAGIFEILWVKKNYKAFKKILFAMQRYQDVPIISADDDCIYMYNYAELFYDIWTTHKSTFVSCYISHYRGTPHTGGAATLYPPHVFGDAGIRILDKTRVYTISNQDDDFYTSLRQRLNLKNAIHGCDYKTLYFFHDEISPSHVEIKTLTKHNRQKLFNKIMLLTLNAII